MIGYWNRVSTYMSPFNVGDSVGIGLSTPLAKLHVLGTTEQMRLDYDGSNYTSFTIDSSGNLTIGNNGTNVATFGRALASFDVPTAFNAAGDVAMAYDLVFTNQNAFLGTVDD